MARISVEDLLGLKPNVVSRDLSSYVTYIYGEPKTGKTTLGSRMEGALLLAFEIGYTTIPGVTAMKIEKWSEFKNIVQLLKDPRLKEKYKIIVIDTVDVACSFCEADVCRDRGVEDLKDLGAFGAGYGFVKKELESAFSKIRNEGYGIMFISHAKDKITKNPLTKEETRQYVPTLSNSYNEIIKNMSEIYAFAEKYVDSTGSPNVRLVIRSSDNSADTGSRFKYITPVIDFTHDALVKAMNDAIDEEEKHYEAGDYFTDFRSSAFTRPVYNYDEEVAKFKANVDEIMKATNGTGGEKITKIVEKYLGAGNKVSDSRPEHVELIALINDELSEMF